MANGDKRSVSTDALETLGTIIDENQKRDAIHLAVIPAVAGSQLKPGQRVDITNGIATKSTDGIGIVDPFLSEHVRKGQHFWLVIKPRVITSLRHVWTHPDIPAEETGSVPVPVNTMSPSEVALRDIASDCGLSFDRLMSAAKYYLKTGEYLHMGDNEEYLPDEFWVHYQAFTGTEVEEDKQYSFFSCAC